MDTRRSAHTRKGPARPSLWGAGLLAVLLAAASPAFAQRGGGGGHGGGGGGHAAMGGGRGGGFSGGGHAAFGGDRMGGFSGARPGGGFAGGRPMGFAGGRPMGFAGGRPMGFAGGRPTGFAGGHNVIGSRSVAAATPRYGSSPGFRGSYSAGRSAAITSYNGRSASVGRSGYVGRPGITGRAGYVGRSGFVGRPGYAYGYGRGRGGWGWSRPYWRGGYWHGGYWPYARYWTGYPWFLGVLPGVYATYYWGGLPYYYVNDVYYTWNSGYNGYVVTDPPPAQDASYTDGNYESTQPDSSGSAAASDGTEGGGEVYAYPSSGQSEEQQSTDRYECHKWAVAQSGFDPTNSSSGGAPSAGNPTDYRRAMGACLDARGYTAK